MENPESEFEIIECICSWYDLLGYGQPLIDSNWNLLDKRCEQQLNRIKALDLTHVNKFSGTHSTTSFTLNDGIILNFDIDSKKDRFKDQLIMVVDDLLLEYENINQRDVRLGNPGVRGIITFGHRYHYTYVESTINLATNFTSAYHPRVFQMNTAFSKAYLLESSGTKAGISGNNLYIDKYLIDKIEYLLKHQSENEDQNKYRIEKNLDNTNESFYFSIMRNDEIFLKIELDINSVDFNNKGINTTLYRYLGRISLQDKLANEAEFLRGQRYLQMERDEFEDN